MHDARDEHFPILPHGGLEEVMPSVLFVVGTMRLFGVFRFSRNMVVLKDGDGLILVNPIRLSPATESELCEHGEIRHILKIGRFHSVDIPYYLDRFGPTLWMLRDDHSLPGIVPDRYLNDYDELPFRDATVFVFDGLKEPECVIHIPDDGGAIIACDSVVNLDRPDPMGNWLVRTLSKTLRMPVLIGPNWLKAAKPTKAHFDALLQLRFRHLLPAHGTPLRNVAKDRLADYVASFDNW